jgi:hypothetical protein
MIACGVSTQGMRAVRIASHQPSLYIARLPTDSKYCCVCRSGASGAVRLSVNGTPWKGCWAMPSTEAGIGILAISRMVGAMSMTWENCDRSPPPAGTMPGQWITIGLRVPPRCEPTCLPHWNGVLPAHAQAAP